MQALGTGGGQLIAVLGDMPAGAGAGARGGPARHRAGRRAAPRGERRRHVTPARRCSPAPAGGSRSCPTPRGWPRRGRNCTGAAPGRGGARRARRPRRARGGRPTRRPRTAAWRGRRRMASHRRTVAAACRGHPRVRVAVPHLHRDGSGSGPGCGVGPRRGARGHGDPAAAAAGPRRPARRRWPRCSSTSTSRSPTPGRCSTCCPRPARSPRCGTLAGQGFSRGVRRTLPRSRSCAAWCCSPPAASASRPCSPT